MENMRFNAEMLTLAREAKGLTQKELAGAIGVQQPFLSKIEADVAVPTDEFLASAARNLDCTPRFFYRWPRAWVPPVVLYRKQQRLGAIALRKINALIRRKRIELERLVASVEIPEPRVPAVAIGERGWTPRRAAEELRAQWQVARGPLANVTDMLEEHGVVVVPMDFETDLISGISTPAADGLPPMIFVGTTLSGDRLRWTLCHELGHLVLHHHLGRDFPPEDAEEEADDFSSEFLMPSDDIRAFLGFLSLRTAGDLKRRWGVSMAALIMRAAQLDRISERRKVSLFIELSKNGWRKREPIDVPVEEAQLHSDVLRAFVDDLHFSVAEVANMLDLPENVVAGRLKSRAALRVVE